MIWLSDFDYELPEELIAQMPAAERDKSRMLVLDRAAQTMEHRQFCDITDYFDENSLLVLNDTRVIPARIYGKKKTGARIEILLLEQFRDCEWKCLIKPSKRVKPGILLKVSPELSVLTLKHLDDEWLVELIHENDLLTILNKVGHVPLPPYIERKKPTKELKNFDMERYQTVYAKREGSVAAPTAGLHFTQEILDKLKAKGTEIAFVTLNVGLGTFLPVKCDDISKHKMHAETFEISSENAAIIKKSKQLGKILTAVGTTTVRTLETVFEKYGEIRACSGRSELFICPPYDFKVTDRLLTNFHLPKSTLLMMVSAFAGKDFIFDAYKTAVRKRYRFFSYGDCMLIK